MSPDSPEAPIRPPHPLAVALIERLRERPGARVLEVGAGSGRNTRALLAAGLYVSSLDAAEPAAAALSTHALLHGTLSSISELLARIASLVEPQGGLFVTFGSVRDARYAVGTEIEEHAYAPVEGDERGVAHTYFDEEGLRRLLERDWLVRSLQEIPVDEVAGSWAHAQAPLHGAIHWFAIADRRD